MAGMDIGIDLGTANVLIVVNDKGIVLNEPSVVAVDNRIDEVIAVGHEAYKMIGKTPKDIEAIRPMMSGVISDYDNAEKMLRGFIEMLGNKKGMGKIVMPRIMVSVPTNINDIEKKAVQDAVKHAGAREVLLIEEPIAAAIGAGIDITVPGGNLVVDIGGGTTDIAVISLGGTVVSKSIKTGGSKFDLDIIRYIKRNYNVIIGERTAERIKIDIGCAYRRREERFIKITGRDLTNGLPKSITVSSLEIMDAMSDSVGQIVNLVIKVLQDTPPELASDIAERGIVLTGGGALLYGMDKKISEMTGLRVRLAEEPINCVALGTGIALGSVDILEIAGTV
ncbi:MAG: rod shape-determining protein [Peptostreptococcus porci]|uniref:Cell shape-determining protein MreB n=1 Tax=Peptostreptococcus porci TaxID=2652282 RepID=A0A6N7WZY8_9FIRM|nr:rod shape-determining protein [Peptostreptococcus porci]MDD7183815.1 rod shape-determining protein [Peptostreptococcus porci]MDY2795529.1 rod shape-determining protein [Peptostreptococcus porci]MDY4127844.1 rod shape-determining protein [Peptostreptococcus porci]MDY5480623.1 rod shape-determining protein [Peptostreptococcus porci]MDY5963951.1 rod shape-determining protein [Peptostreptococcus porci]